MSNNEETLIRVEDLKVHFPIYRGVIRRQVGSVKAVDGVSFQVKKGETLGLVGESGCGKTTTGRAIVQLYKPTAGHVYFRDIDLVSLKEEPMRLMRKEIQMIFQDPYASLNPRMTVRDIISEPLLAFGMATGKQLDNRVKELMRLVRLDPDFIYRFPHEFSGGQRQRIGIARALALNPAFIVCDEPISALDVSIQAQIINLFEDLQKELNLTYLFIAHDLSMVRHISDRVAVMYLGIIVELADRNEIYNNPLHPYTQALLSAIPVPDPEHYRKRSRIVLEGDVPSPANPPSGCRFRTRCPKADEECEKGRPEFREILPGHFVECFKAEVPSPLKEVTFEENSILK
ncbi:MAG: dipeptide ABC transporter ATP-binding protein [Anaerolineaceae bacterium]|jgi:oligopeptide transport system ATP-binding protein|nr:dipeptide ABC transporter ATP-binding protein [Anaerolineaceae bacterium]HQJ32127.1 dipeptide ABC transporter ATP-binding protein [Anaerolineaceae bacterium]